MSDTIITVENLSKRYIISHQTGSGDGLRHRIEDLARAPLRWMKSKFRNNGNDAVNGGGQPGAPGQEEFWALKDVSFEIKRGDVVGIIGRNGAGKSTLLKILSRIVEPTNGRIVIDGRVASLLEVGTGFHPELTGRENIFLNGAILGMSRVEIKKKFDEIVAFAETEKFLDTPVKRYSSGMYVRLAFAVAAHLEPEILIVDEVLAVGDTEFQKKCIGKMQDVAGHGRTVLFVSHNLSVMTTLCNSAILLKKGRIDRIGEPHALAEYYLKLGKTSDESGFEGVFTDKYANIYRTYAHQGAALQASFQSHLPITLGIEIELLSDIVGLIVQARVLGSDGRRLILTNFDDTSVHPPGVFKSGRYVFECHVPPDTLSRGSYRAAFWIGIHNKHLIAAEFGGIHIQIENTAGIGRWYYAEGDYESVLRPRFAWVVNKINN